MPALQLLQLLCRSLDIKNTENASDSIQ
jgi:hypothetical protein